VGYGVRGLVGQGDGARSRQREDKSWMGFDKHGREWQEVVCVSSYLLDIIRMGQ